jgi:hypothetical protein
MKERQLSVLIAAAAPEDRAATHDALSRVLPGFWCKCHTWAFVKPEADFFSFFTMLSRKETVIEKKGLLSSVLVLGSLLWQ